FARCDRYAGYGGASIFQIAPFRRQVPVRRSPHRTRPASRDSGQLLWCSYRPIELRIRSLFGYRNLDCNLRPASRSIVWRWKMDSRLNRSWWVLRIGLGVVPIVAGTDKFFDVLTNWEMYLNPLAPRVLHLAPATLMHVFGIVEIVVGVAMFTRYTRI